ncbi:heat shock 70 kDa protein 12B-like [Saccostrea cucullata]|uniref:heat shock 70 kDa protein 12B-like n=1 Tax=Saccostrea cuccullata TaxID=36930 RepID=UPI002ED23A40
MADNDDWLVGAALDFGTMYSGYAFSFRDSPNDIHTPQTWYAGSTTLASSKTPTCLLLNPDKTFNSFGYEAQDKYADLASEERHREYLYFEHFKMTLHYEKNGHGGVGERLGKSEKVPLQFYLCLKCIECGAYFGRRTKNILNTVPTRPNLITKQSQKVVPDSAIWNCCGTTLRTL